MANTATQLQHYSKMRRRRGRIVTIIIAALLALAILIGAVSYYGDHVGSFLISVEKDSRVALSLSETYDFANPRDMLSPTGVKDQTNTSFFYLDLDRLNSYPGGVHSDLEFHEYFAYTFYLKNSSRSGQTIDYDVKISLRTASKNVDEAIRIMLVRNRDIYNSTSNRWIFAKADRDSETGERLTEGGVNTTTTFDGTNSYDSTIFSGKTVCSIPIKAFTRDMIDTYTVVMWLEGDDPDCVDSIKGGAVMLDMDFTISDIHD